LKVRGLLDQLKDWIEARAQDLQNGTTPNPDQTIAWY
jgi:hypothetical protein